MKKSLIAVIVLSMGIIACSDEANTDTPSNEQEFVKTVNVESYKIEPLTFKNFLRVVGRVETADDIMISAEVSGRLLSYSVKVGDIVKKGEIIAKIDDSKLKSEQQSLQAQVNQAETTFKRLEKIYKESNIGSELDYLNAKYTYEQSKSALESLNVDLANTNVKAPFTGTLENVIVEAGEMASLGMPLLRLISSERLIISAGIPARYSSAVNVGDEVEIWFDGQNMDTLNAKIEFVARSINTENRTFTVEIPLPSVTNNPKVDMLANIRLNTNTENDVLVVSDEFIYKDGDDYVIFVVSTDENGNCVAERRVITLGSTYKTDAVIASGLNTGDEVITTGSAFLIDGMRIKVVENSNNSYAAK